MMLRSISVPCLAGDSQKFSRLLDVWSDPRLFPLDSYRFMGPVTLMVVVNRAQESTVEEFTSVFRAHTALHDVFVGFTVRDAALEGDRDVYIRPGGTTVGALGNKAGPNYLFFETMRFASEFGGFTFQNEIDCYPICKGWLEDLARIVNDWSKTWVIGSYYIGEMPVALPIQYHLNGNALYNAGNTQFQQFLKKIWEPRLFELARLDPDLAYDCWWALEKFRASSGIKNVSWEIVRTYDHFIQSYPYIINFLFKETIGADLATADEINRKAGGRILFAHGQAMHEVYEAILAAPESEPHKVLAKISPPATSEGGSEDYTEEEISIFEAQLVSQRAVLSQAEIFKGLLLERFLVPDDGAIIYAHDIVPASCIGNWYPRNPGDALWMGPGEAALLFEMATPAKRVEVEVHGLSGSLDAAATVVVFVHGGIEPVKGRLDSQGGFQAEVINPNGIREFSVQFSADRYRTVEGDERDLAFAFFYARVSPT